MAQLNYSSTPIGHVADPWTATTDDGMHDASGPDPLAAALELCAVLERVVAP